MRFVSLTDPAFHLVTINPVFHGRDIFAPVAAHLALGVDICSLGDSFTDPVILST
jgi:S-adenosylmethionine hydrolase